MLYEKYYLFPNNIWKIHIYKLYIQIIKYYLKYFSHKKRIIIINLDFILNDIFF